MKILNKIHSRFAKLTYVRIIAMGYLMVILVGTFLLMLPVSTVRGKRQGFSQRFLRRQAPPA